jgi:hypothetical protein
MMLSGRSIEAWDGPRGCHEHEKHALITAGASNSGELRSKYGGRDKRPTLASMVVIAVNPAGLSGKMLKVLEMLLGESLHTPKARVWRWLLLPQAEDCEFSCTYQLHAGARGSVLSQFAMKSNKGVNGAHGGVETLMACLDAVLGGLSTKQRR